MVRFLEFVRNLRITSKVKVEEKASRAAEAATMEERRWHEHGGDKGSIITMQESEGDYSYLYEDHVTTPVGKNIPKALLKELKENKGKLPPSMKILEAFIGGFTNRDLLFVTEQPLVELWAMQQATLSKYFTDPHCRSIINNWTAYTIGGGIKVHIENAKVMMVIDKFRVANRMIKREKQLIKMFFIEGELFIAYYGGYPIKIRRIRPEEIVETETLDNDIETHLGYHWQYETTREGSSQIHKVDKWVRSIDYDDLDNKEKKSKGKPPAKDSAKQYKDNPVIQHIKWGLDEEIRGRVPLQGILRYLKYYEDWLLDRIRLNHERAKVVWIKEIKGNRGVEATTRERRAPRGGIMLIETQDVHYRIESSKLESDDAKEDGMQILYAIGAGTSLPIHILNQRSDQQVYASIRKADTPFSQFIRTQQEFFAESFERMYRQVIQSAIDKKKLPKTIRIPYYPDISLAEVFQTINEMVIEGCDAENIVREIKTQLGDKPSTRKINTIDVPIDLEFPEIIREDSESQAKVLKIHKEIGIASLATLSAKAGYSWKQELHYLLQERRLAKELGPDEEPEKEKDEEKDEEE